MLSYILHSLVTGTLLLRHHMATNSPPLVAPPWQTMLVLASERNLFFSDKQALGVTTETAGAEAARLYGNIAVEWTMVGAHLAMVQQCASGEDAEFVSLLRSFLQPRLVKQDFVLHSIASAQTPLTSIARNGTRVPQIERLNKPILFVLSSPRSGSSLLQLCLQANVVS